MDQADGSGPASVEKVTLAPSTDRRFEEIVAAYKRGAAWMQQNPDYPEYVAKAAYDYADKVTAPTPTSNSTEA